MHKGGVSKIKGAGFYYSQPKYKGTTVGAFCFKIAGGGGEEEA